MPVPSPSSDGLDETLKTSQETLETANLLLQALAQELVLPTVSTDEALYTLMEHLHHRFLQMQHLLKQCHETRETLSTCMTHMMERTQQCHTLLSALRCVAPHGALHDLPEHWSPEQLGITLSTPLDTVLPTASCQVPQVAQCDPPFQQYPEIPQDLTSATFMPHEAFALTDQSFRDKHSVVYAMFQAIVLQGGRASTEQIKQYLVSMGMTQKDGTPYDHAPATKITTHVNYLVRRKLVALTGAGVYVSRFGWQKSS
ncbi:MAG: hypothetical protein ACKO37_04100 [Vampirovibrionales bacterium]